MRVATVDHSWHVHSSVKLLDALQEGSRELEFESVGGRGLVRYEVASREGEEGVRYYVLKEIKSQDRIRRELTREIMKIFGCCKYNIAQMESLGIKYARKDEDSPKKTWEMYQIIEEVKKSCEVTSSTERNLQIECTSQVHYAIKSWIEGIIEKVKRK